MKKLFALLLAALLLFSCSSCTLNIPEASQNPSSLSSSDEAFSLSEVPAFSGDAFAVIHENIPYFKTEEITSVAFEQYAPLDFLDRCGVCIASVGTELMPKEARESISSVKPSGWQSIEMKQVDGGHLYNRCHLIGFQLTGENANPRNLITGTRYLNVEGMLPFENMIADFIKETGYHVMYRVTPVFEGQNLVASGVLLEGFSVEDRGAGICFCVYCYNVQPGVTISYADGFAKAGSSLSNPTPGEKTYVLNTNSRKFHRLDCESTADISQKNKEVTALSRDDLTAQGYAPCKNCNP